METQPLTPQLTLNQPQRLVIPRFRRYGSSEDPHRRPLLTATATLTCSAD